MKLTQLRETLKSTSYLTMKKQVNKKNVHEPHYVKSVRIQSYSGPHFPAFGVNTQRCGVSLRIPSECGKMWTRIIPNTDTFHEVLEVCQSVLSNKYEEQKVNYNS